MNKIKSLELLGWKEFNAELFDKALVIFDKIESAEPGNIGALQGKIACYRKKSDFKTASSILDQAVALYPNEPGLLSEKAWFYLDQKQYDQAINAFTAVLNVKKDDVGLFLWQLYLLRSQRNYQQASTLLKEARALFPSNTSLIIEEGWLAFYLLQYDDSIQVFSQVLKNEPYNELAFQGKIACLRMQSFYLEALDLSNIAIAKLNKSPGIFSERGWINLEMQNFDAAEEDFRIVLSLVSNDPYVHINLAWTLIKQNSSYNLDEATKHCKYALAMQPDLSEALSCLGNIAFKNGNIREAESYFCRSIKSDSKKGAYADLGALYIQMGRYDDAKEQLDQALKNNSNDMYARLEMGYLYLNTDKIKEAIREFKTVSMMDPNSSESFKALGIALTENKNFIEAEKVLRSAIKIFDEQKSYGLHLALSQLLTLYGDQMNNPSYYEEALKEVQNAIRIKPDDASCYFYSGIIRFKLEDYKNSLNFFSKCLKQDAKYLEAELNSKRIKEIMQKEKALVRSSKFSSFFLTFIFLVQLVFVWFLYLHTEKMTSAIISILVPILSGLLIISVLLPWLSRFKMSGIEADLTDTKPKESLASGPKGEMMLSNNFRNAL